MTKTGSSSSTRSDVTLILGSFTGGGTERVAVNMINHWISNGRNVHVITRHGSEKDFYELPSIVSRTVLGDKGDSPNKLVGFFRNIERILLLRGAIASEGAPVIVSMLSRNNVLTVLASLGLNKKVVISERNDPSKQKQSWPWESLRSMVYRFADVITANSKSAVESMRSYVDPSKLVYLPNPVLIPEYTAEVHEAKMVLNVGRLVSQKGQDILLEAFSNVNRQNPDWTLRILGEGEERKNLESEISLLGLNEVVQLEGLVSNPSTFYRSAAMFILPSRFEGTPNALLEAMAMGLPCIVSDAVLGAEDLIEDGITGFWFRSGDSEHLSDQILRLMEDADLRSRLGLSARKQVMKFSPEKVSHVWEEVIWG